MRVAILSVHSCPLGRLGSKDTGGMQVYVREVARQLASRGVAVDMFTRRQSGSAPPVIPAGEGARLIHLEAGPVAVVDKNDLYPHLPQFVDNLLRFQAAEGLRYDWIFSHYWLSGWAGSMLREQWRVPLVNMFHTLGLLKNAGEGDDRIKETDLRIVTERRIVQLADLLVAANPTEMDHMIHLYDAPRAKVQVIPCGVNFLIFRPIDQQEARRQLGLEAEKIMLFVGRMDPIKGIDTLLKAASIVMHGAEDGSRYRLLIVGGDSAEGTEAADSALMQRYRAMSRELGIEDRVSFVGSVPQQQLPCYYSAADVCVVPSHYESFGLVAIESMACGTPVIGSRVGGLQHTIIDGHNGYLVPWRCPAAFAERIQMMLTAQDRVIKRLRLQSRRSVRHFSWSSVAEELLDAVASLIGETVPASACQG